MDNPLEHPEQQDSASDLENFFHLSFDKIGLDHLRQIAIWAKVVSIAAFVGYVIQLYLWLSGRSQVTAALGGLAGTLVNLVVLVGGGVLNYFLYRFAVAVSRGIENTDAYHVNSGFNSLRIYFKTYAIVVIIGLCVMAFAVIVSVMSDIEKLQ